MRETYLEECTAQLEQGSGGPLLHLTLTWDPCWIMESPIVLRGVTKTTGARVSFTCKA